MNLQKYQSTVIESIIRNYYRNMYIYAKEGSGKTFTIISLFINLIENAKNGGYVLNDEEVIILCSTKHNKEELKSLYQNIKNSNLLTKEYNIKIETTEDFFKRYALSKSDVYDNSILDILFKNSDSIKKVKSSLEFAKENADDYQEELKGVEQFQNYQSILNDKMVQGKRRILDRYDTVIEFYKKCQGTEIPYAHIIVDNYNELTEIEKIALLTISNYHKARIIAFTNEDMDNTFLHFDCKEEMKIRYMKQDSITINVIPHSKYHNSIKDKIAIITDDRDGIREVAKKLDSIKSPYAIIYPESEETFLKHIFENIKGNLNLYLAFLLAKVDENDTNTEKNKNILIEIFKEKPISEELIKESFFHGIIHEKSFKANVRLFLSVTKQSDGFDQADLVRLLNQIPEKSILSHARLIEIAKKTKCDNITDFLSSIYNEYFKDSGAMTKVLDAKTAKYYYFPAILYAETANDGGRAYKKIYYTDKNIPQKFKKIAITEERERS